MKRSTRRWLLKVAREGYADAHPVNAADALDSEKRLKAEVRRKDAALRLAVKYLPSGYLLGDTLRAALRPAKKR